MIPIDPNGYSVNPSTATVHRRYAGEHAGQSQRTRTVKGVEHYLDGRKPTICATCFPAPQYPQAHNPRAPQVRRSAPKS